MAYPTSATSFNPQAPRTMYVDLNSCFATIEQQANPLLRGKPVVVAAYDKAHGCILTPSIEAKRLGIKVGMRVKEGKALCPSLIVLTPDPGKYRFINRKLFALLQPYAETIAVKSIDEMVLTFPNEVSHVYDIAQEIKQKIKRHLGSWIRVSIGIAPNRYLAKVASGLKKPDGLIEINRNNYIHLFQKLPVQELCGIKYGNMTRLNSVGVFTALDLYNATVERLQRAFQSVLSYYWNLRMHGYEIDDVEFPQKSYGQSYVLQQPTADRKNISQLLCKLVEKMGSRLRHGGFGAKGVHLACHYKDHTFWHRGETRTPIMYASQDLFAFAKRLLEESPKLVVQSLAVTCFHLEKLPYRQLSLFAEEEKKLALIEALDKVNDKFGSFTITPARMLEAKDQIPDRIAFGRIRELEDFIVQGV